MTNYDYSPVPSYMAPTQGNMEQAAAQIANWLRTKGNGQDVRESLAQAVQLFGDVATQFINEAGGLKGQFNNAIANANTNSEVAAARTSTVSGTGYTTLGARLDAIDTLTSNVSTDHAQTATNVNNIAGLSANLTQLQTNIDAGLPTTSSGYSTDGISLLNGTTIESGGYKIVNFASFKIVEIFMPINLSVTGQTDILKFPFSLNTRNSLQTNNGGGLYFTYWNSNGTVTFAHEIVSSSYGATYPPEIDLRELFILDK